jgi:hypothetical protein
MLRIVRPRPGGPAARARYPGINIEGGDDDRSNGDAALGHGDHPKRMGPEGPWTVIATYNTPGYQHHQEYFTTTSGATDKFQRFIRWRLDISDDTMSSWDLCMRICALLK